ncbi:MAG TPA: EamA family transporter [Elusimicrobiales bacterium]|nr:EamA family transporter [Elusimicrobiales bacterium]
MWITYSLLSALFSALCAILEKKALFKLAPFDFSLALYACLAALFAAAFLLTGGNFAAIGPRELASIYVKSLANVVSFLFIMNGIRRMELSAGLPLLLLAPALVAVTAYALFGDALSARQAGGIALITAGGYLLVRGRSGAGRAGDMRAYLYYCAALLVLTASSLLNRYILVSRNVPPLPFAAAEHLLALANFLPAALLLRRSPAPALLALRSAPLAIGGTAAGTALYRYFEVAAMAQASPALVVALKRLSVVMAVLIGGKLFREKDVARRSAAALIMFAGVWLIIR